MLNLRKLKQDFSSAILKEGKDLFETKKVLSAKILHLDATTIRISARVLGQYNNTYESEIEIDRMDSETIDSDCNCPYHYDCQHLAAVLFHLESCLDEILVKFSKETDIEEVTEDDSFCHEEKEKLLEAVKEAETKEAERKDEEYQKELLKEYIGASSLLAKSPFFLPAQQREIEKAELAVIFHFSKKGGSNVDVQLALRLPSRSKPLHIPNVRQFLEAVRYREPLYVGGKSHLFSLESFQESEQEIARLVMDHAKLPEKVTNERAQKMASLDMKIFGMIMAKAEEIASKMLKQKGWTYQDDELPTLPCLFEENLESPIHFSKSHANVNVTLEYIHPPTSKILLNPMLLVDQQKIVLEDARFFECAKPGIIYNHVYYRFSERITRQHLRSLMPMRDMTIPEPLFGTAPLGASPLFLQPL